MRIWLAVRAFWAVVADRVAAERVREALAPRAVTKAETHRGPGAGVPSHEPPSPVPPATVRPRGRSEAVTLLATLQREARFLDIVQEPLAEYSDEQIGAAAREVLRNCAKVLERLFALQPALPDVEGSEIEIPRGYDPLRFHMVGNVAGEPPFRGKLVHRGWIATRCELPAWSGSTQAANVVAPVEVEVG
jgi:hypothetical protein